MKHILLFDWVEIVLSQRRFLCMDHLTMIVETFSYMQIIYWLVSYANLCICYVHIHDAVMNIFMNDDITPDVFLHNFYSWIFDIFLYMDFYCHLLFLLQAGIICFFVEFKAKLKFHSMFLLSECVIYWWTIDLLMTLIVLRLSAFLFNCSLFPLCIFHCPCFYTIYLFTMPHH